ncbi:hypothetical protein QBC35DRAFT_476016 [Podospora australis]|uniref:Tetraspanin n=1 Tax=Podospora australis TaxID=1536484 RepID=A0AAN6WSV9_9PEZI|nr:hypothetical protein QBC35DRAFT_476016 [Podospora australis]
MALLLWLYPLLALTLFGVAIYIHVHTTTLSLPISPLLTITTILLPIFAFLVPMISSIFPVLKRLKVNGLLSLWQLSQFTLTTILGTLYASSISPTAPCVPEATWHKFWQNHDADTIRTIQDFFSCCGFRSVKDMAWPFDSPQKNTCAIQFHRQQSCKGPWEGKLTKMSGVGLGVVLATFLLQVMPFMVRRQNRNERGWGVGRIIQEVFTQGDNAGVEEDNGGIERGVRRPLLGAVPSAQHVESNADQLDGRNGRLEEGRTQDAGDGGYGGTGTDGGQRQGDAGGPRVEVSHHHQDPWADADRG